MTIAVTRRLIIRRSVEMVNEKIAGSWGFSGTILYLQWYILREIIKQLAYNYKSFGLDIISREHINYHFIIIIEQQISN